MTRPMTPEGDGNGEHGADERHRGRPQAAEHEEQQQEQERQGEELGTAEVLRGDRGDLDVGRRWGPRARCCP